jgi:ParB family chromosome partitioning protein
VASPEIRRLEQTLTERLGSPVTLAHRADSGGELRIAYHDLDVLDGILARILPEEL